MSPRLVSMPICRESGLPADGQCESMTEWFVPGTIPTAARATPPAPEYRIIEPTPGLPLARDPRIPDELEAFSMSVATVPGLREVEWHIDGIPVSHTPTGELTWRLVPGRHEVFAKIRAGDSDEAHPTAKVRFYVR
jgi:penicillin-binding protein 1C